MSGSSLEEIKLVIENVKHKKVEGVLYLMNERLAWMPKQKTTLTTSHHYVDIKTQKISTEGKAKVQLQVVLHDDTSSTFHFISPSGPSQQIKDRDQVKDMLASLLPKFKQKISKELEDKKRILIDNPNIYQLYNELVVGQIVNAEDFWKNFVDFNQLKEGPKNQPTGVSQGFMSNICAKSDGSSGLIYNISYDDIQSIFKTYPEVKLKYIQNVPQKMTELEFWDKFFQSYYFRRDKINAGANDLFSDSSAKDNEELRAKGQKIFDDPLMGLSNQKDLTSEDGFGLTDFLGNKVSNQANQNLIKRYNFYSMRVLNSMEETSSKAEANKRAGETVTIGKKAKKRLNEEIPDLTNEVNAGMRGASLNLCQIDRYSHAPRADESDVSQLDELLKGHNVKQMCLTALNSLNEWKLSMAKVFDVANPSQAISILVELSPGSVLMQTNGVRNLKDEIPKVKQDEIKALYLASSEMLKNFYRIFPPKNAENEKKLESIRENLESYFDQKIAGLSQNVVMDNFAWNMSMHLENMFKIAFTKYNTWKTRQTSI